jgi:predicted kinase
VVRKPTLFLTVGLPGAGKTTMARSLAAELHLLRLTPDEWMAPLFGESDADGRRDIIEGRMIWTALRVLTGSGSVILDFGCWSADERYAIRHLAEAAGGRFELVLAETDEQERRRRADQRWEDAPHTTFAMTPEDHDRFLAGYQPPSAEELGYRPVPPPPAGFADWASWAADRWPTLPRVPGW